MPTLRSFPLCLAALAGLLAMPGQAATLPPAPEQTHAIGSIALTLVLMVTLTGVIWRLVTRGLSGRATSSVPETLMVAPTPDEDAANAHARRVQRALDEAVRLQHANIGVKPSRRLSESSPSPPGPRGLQPQSLTARATFGRRG